MLKKKKIILFSLCALLIILGSITALASEQRTIYQTVKYTSSSSSITTPTFKLNADRLSYSFSRTSTPNDHTTTLTLQKYTNSKWVDIESSTLVGSRGRSSSFDNLDSSATYRAKLTTTHSSSESTYLLLYE
ncbi:hypothetical protein LXJ15735_27660 [Lacrimispora xylanolytica]